MSVECHGARMISKAPLPRRLEVEVPLPCTGDNDDPRSPGRVIIRMKQVAIRAVNEIFVTKNDIKFL